MTAVIATVFIAGIGESGSALVSADADSGAAVVGRSAEAVGEVRSLSLKRSRPGRSSASCPDHHASVRFYRSRYIEHRTERGESTNRPVGRDPRSCADALYVSGVWASRALRERRTTERFWRAIQSDSQAAIMYVFGPVYGPQALRVASCESGWSRTPRAVNGQYLGMFQMGEWERATYGHGEDRLTQARAAYAYFVASGKDWSPWSCKP
jgi:hypothetical protein